VNSQTPSDVIINSFEKYLKVPEEVIHLHLNKQILVEGDELGISAYVFEKKNQLPSVITSNLYIQLLDQDDNIVIEKMLLVQNGSAQGYLSIDESIKAGSYKIIAFTNWMNNFDSPHYYEEQLQIVSLNDDVSLINTRIEDEIELKMMPEGGRAIHNVFVEVGLLFKNKGKGISADGELLENGKVIAKVSTNEMGLGRFKWLPNENSTFTLKMNAQSGEVIRNLPKIETTGVGIIVKQTKEKVLIEVLTNEESLNNENLKSLYLIVNSIRDLNGQNVNLERLKETYSIDKSTLASGVNEIILMDENRNVILSRLFFNHDSFNVISDVKITKTESGIDQKFELDFDPLSGSSQGVVSISILPAETKAALGNSNIIKSLKLRPYLTGSIENPMYYFTDVDVRKKNDLDNLLLCQGWTIYDWSAIFKGKEVYHYDFEDGIIVKVNVNNKKHHNFLVYPTTFSKSRLSTKTDSTFVHNKFYPLEDEQFRLSAMLKEGKSEKTAIYPIFYPNKIPVFNSFHQDNKEYVLCDLAYDLDDKLYSDVKVETLDTVMLQFNKEKKRKQIIKNKAKGKVYFLRENDRISFPSVFLYLNNFAGVSARDINGDYRLAFTRPWRIGGLADPVLFLDENFTTDFNILRGIDMYIVDYIEINDNNIGGRASANGGYVRIVTNPELDRKLKNKNTISAFDIPLRFQAPKDFYRPTYSNYSSKSFLELGVIDWKGNVKIGENGKAIIQIPNLGLDQAIFYIQGWAYDGKLIDIEKMVSLK
jgi:hypothetical protein